MIRRVVLLGSGGHARVVVEILRMMHEVDIVGVVTADRNVSEFSGAPVLGQDEVLPRLLDDGVALFAMGVGGFRSNDLRAEVFERTVELGLVPVSPTHPAAEVSPSASVGRGSVLFAKAVLNPAVRLGRNTIVATGATVDHDTVVEDHVLVSAGVTVGACVTIRERALLAIGSTVVSGVEIGRGALVAAGAVVIRNVPDGAAVAGVPARLFKTR